MSDPITATVSEFESDEQAARYDRWFRAKVQASRDDSRPGIPHGEAMAHIRRKLAAERAAKETGLRSPATYPGKARAGTVQSGRVCSLVECLLGSRTDQQQGYKRERLQP